MGLNREQVLLVQSSTARRMDSVFRHRRPTVVNRPPLQRASAQSGFSNREKSCFLGRADVDPRKP